MGSDCPAQASGRRKRRGKMDARGKFPVCFYIWGAVVSHGGDWALPGGVVNGFSIVARPLISQSPAAAVSSPSILIRLLRQTMESCPSA